MPHRRTRSKSRRVRKKKPRVRRVKKTIRKRKVSKKKVSRRARTARPVMPKLRDNLALSVLGHPDARPQTLGVMTTLSVGVDVYTVTSFNIPVAPVGDHGKVMVFEILSLDWYLYPGSISNISARALLGFLTTQDGVAGRSTGDTCNEASIENDMLSGANIGPVELIHQFFTDSATVSTGTGEALALSAAADSYRMPIHVDMTDGVGNGFVVATDRLSIVFGNRNEASGARIICRIKYRNIVVSALEFIAISKSQS